jgi:hypothetical protein
MPLFLAAVLVAPRVAGGAENIDPANDGHQYAWSENAGWINAEPSGDGGPGAEVGDFGLIGWLWGENIGWVSLSCENTGSCTTSSYRVQNDGFGVLSGFAWSENAGWINFDPTACDPDPTCGVRIDPSTGYIRGRAWGENVGWITFASGSPIESTARTSWCQGTAAAPGSGFTLSVAKSGSSVLLSWSTLPQASWYDVVRGRLSTLRNSRGNFAASTEECVAGRLTGTTQPFSGPSVSPGDGLWFLVRGANCKGHGTFDTGHPSQVGARDAEIAASGHDCH